MQKERFPLFFLFLAMLLLAASLAGCQKSSGKASLDLTPVATLAADAESAPAPAANPVPSEITIKTALRPAIDPACLEDKGKFAIVSAPLPADGLEPGMVHVFCATDAPAGEVVTFTLKAPDGHEQSYQTTSVEQGAVVAAVQPVAIGADAKPGKWTLTASAQDQHDAITFKVKAATQPFITLSEPVSDNPAVIRVAIGGMAPGARAHFAIYRLQPGQTGAATAEARGDLLIENLVQVDEQGRADVVLDVADQPGGPYLLALLPADGAGTASAVITLPEQERTALAINIRRQGEPGGAAAVSGVETTSVIPQNLPPAPQLTEAGGGLPDVTVVALPDTQLPPCAPTTAPTVQLWPQTGEVGQWWYGCASGFSPDKPLRVDASLGNGATTSFDLTKTDADGVKSFRWYSLAEEGAGAFAITVSDLKGNKAETQWTISSATQPHLLVYPHVVFKEVSAQLSLTHFPKRASVQLGIYQIDEIGNASLVKKMTLKTNKLGAIQQAFTVANELQPGTYLLMAQSAPTYQFAGIKTPATAIEFFSVGVPLAEKYESYALFVGRETGAQATVNGGGGNAAANEGSTSGATSASGLPATLTVAADNSAPPVCPNAKPGSPAICIMPSIVQRATYVYMLMHNVDPGAKFGITVTPPKGAAVRMTVLANADGIAEAHWYALNNERLGVYKVRIRGGGKTLNDTFKVVKAKAPHIVVQPRTPEAGTPVIISVSGLQPNTSYVLARYRSDGEIGGQVQFKFVATTKITTGKGGGAQATFATNAADKGALFLATVYKQGGSQPLAQEVYAPGQELYLRYPFAWGQTGN